MTEVICEAHDRGISERWAAWLATFNPPGYRSAADNYTRQRMAWHWRQATWDMRLHGLEAQP